MRFLFFIFLILLTLSLPWWAIIPLWLLYAFRYTAYELVVFGVLLDAYVGAGTPFHVVYTGIATLSCIGMEWLKPRMVTSELH